MDDKELLTLRHRLVEVYEEDGSFGVFQYIEDLYPGLPWSFCVTCDRETPFVDDSCAVCFSMVQLRIKFHKSHRE